MFLLDYDYVVVYYFYDFTMTADCYDLMVGKTRVCQTC